MIGRDGSWRQLARLPDPIGFAGPIAGVSGGALLFAGGSNFAGGEVFAGAPKISVLTKRDRLRAALLSSIGHDLRMPGLSSGLGQFFQGRPVNHARKAEPS